MPRDRTRADRRVYAIIRTRRSVVRRRIYRTLDPAWEDDLIEIVTGRKAADDAAERHWIARRKELGYGEGWFVKRDACGRWRMHDARHHPIPQHVTPDHRGLKWNDADTLVAHLRDADHGKRLKDRRVKQGTLVRLRDVLRKPPMDFEVSGNEVARFLAYRGIVRA